MKIVAVVPMKLNNTRLPQKNTKPFHNGKPLCHYILSTLLQVEEIDEVLSGGSLFLNITTINVISDIEDNIKNNVINFSILFLFIFCFSFL